MAARVCITLLIICAGMHLQAQTLFLRLTGESTYARDTFAYRITDSTGYRYTGKHTSNMKTGEHQYDTAVRWKMAATNIPRKQWLRSFDTADRIATHTAQDYINGNWRNAQRYLYKYQSGGLYDTVIIQNWDTTNSIWNTVRLYKYINTSGKTDTIHWLKPNGTGWATEGRDVYLYTTGNLMQHHLDIWNDTLVQWDRWQQEEYHYNVLNQLDTYILKTIDLPTLTLEPATKEAYQYDAGKLISSHWYFAWFKPALRWEGTYWHYYNYNAHNDTDLETINYWDIGTQQWGPQSRLYYYYDTAYNITDIVEKRFDFPGYTEYSKVTWVYNTNKLPTSKRNFTWYAPTNFWMPKAGDNSQVLYYYEAYATAIKENLLTTENKQLVLYPNPAMQYVHVQLQWAQSRPYTITIHDMQGRLMRQWQYTAATECRQQLQLSGLAAGQYILRAGNGNEEMTKPLIIANQ